MAPVIIFSKRMKKKIKVKCWQPKFESFSEVLKFEHEL